MLVNMVAFTKAFNLATPINLLHLYLYFHIRLDYTFNSKKNLRLIIIFNNLLSSHYWFVLRKNKPNNKAAICNIYTLLYPLFFL